MAKAFGRDLIEERKDQSETLNFKIERVRFVNDGGFFVFECWNGKQISIVTGVANGASKDWVGREINCVGSWQQDDKWGQQFKVKSLVPVLPKNQSSLEIFFANKVEGLGPAGLKKLNAKFGDGVLDMIEAHPHKLLDVLDEEKIEDLHNYWKKEKYIFDIKTSLAKNGLTEGQINKVYEIFKEETLSKIKKDPYAIMTVEGIGFKVADKMALNMGIAKDNPLRIRASLYENLKQKTDNEGNTIIEKNDFIKTAIKDLSVSPDIIQKCYDNLNKTNSFYERQINGIDYVSLTKIAMEEKEIAENILRVANGYAQNVSFKIFNKKLDESQMNAVQGIWNNKFSIITGGPGTGKTTIIKEIIENASANDLKVVLLAPTGKASKRMTEATNLAASTVHRKLKYSGTGFDCNESNRLHGDLFIIDEYSMMDTSLSAALLKSIPSDARILIVGDSDQLPSVGAGEILRDLIDSNLIPFYKLKFTHRQAKGSGIAVAANNVINGIMPVLDNNFDNDFIFVKSQKDEEIYKQIIEAVKELEKRGVSRRDIQILAPQKNHLVGVEELNDGLKYLFNEQWEKPLPPEFKNLNFKYRIGDKVMQRKNNYELNIYNGDMGYIKQIFPNKAIVDFDGEDKTFAGENLSELDLAYSFTVHKSQGSEAPFVIMPLSYSHLFTLNRNIIYTAITRAKQKFVMVGDPDVFKKAIALEKKHERTTGLPFELLSILSNKVNFKMN